MIEDEFSAISQLLDTAKIDAMSSAELAAILSKLGADSRDTRTSFASIMPLRNQLQETETIMNFREKIVDKRPAPKFNDVLKFV